MSKSYKKRLVLLDGNAILHRGYHALPDFTTKAGEPTGALYGLCLMLLGIIKDLEPDEIVACFDLAAPTHRHEAFADYKAHRPKTDEALIKQITRARDVLDAFAIPYFSQEGFEADDLLGTIAEEMKQDEDVQVVIASGDHDTLQLVEDEKTLVYTQRRGIKDTILYNEERVKEKYGFAPEFLPDFKGLSGDSSDNIPGIKGVGEKTATRVITTFGHLEDIYTKLEENKDDVDFVDAGLTTRFIKLLREGEDEAKFSKELATIRLDAPIDFQMPERPWRERIDKSEIDELFAQLEFGSLQARVNREIFNNKEEEDKEGGAEDNDEADVSKQRIKEAQIALWLCDSSKTDPTLEDVYIYTDTDNFSAAMTALTQEMKDKEVFAVFEEIEQPLIPVVQRMTEVGVEIDVEYLSKLSNEYQKKLDKIEKKIYKEVSHEFNINSPQQLAEVMFAELEIPTSGLAKTSTGAISTRESELEKLADEHDIAAYMLQHRGVQKLLSTYINALPERVSADGRLHADFLQTGTATGRMSSKNPNLQNIPVKSADGRKIRGAFVAKEGARLVALDYSQIELRIAAWLSGDEKLISVFKEGRDIHAAVAADVFSVAEEAVTKSQRSAAKVINFGMLYGMGVDALRKNLGGGTSRSEAQDYLDQYFAAYPGLAKFIEEKKQEARKQGYTSTHFGRRRYFPEIYSSRSWVQASAERMAVNAPVQGTQADIIKKAMVAVAEYLKEENLEGEAALLLQVHDELIYEIDADKVEAVTAEIKRIMESVLPKELTAGINFVADTSVGPRWNELKPLDI
ncbi:MAG: DNA polymerase [Candidatus Paceibacterota bacterium]